MTDDFTEKEKDFIKEVSSLTQMLQEKKASFNFIEKILHFFKIKKIQEELELKEKKQAFDLVKNEYKKNLAKIESENKTFFEKEKKLQTRYSDMQETIKKIIEYEDGKIIGDGRSDFTKHNQTYEFEYGNNKFNLIDVPGIEGSEQIVMDVVWEAVKKAHAVFYVTTKAARPQTGDNNQKGTLEKIKEHLGMQTEVWTIFNKRINNPRQLNQLISEDEKKSLCDLDDTFKEFFDKRYCGCIPISALPAFLSISECLAFSSDRYKQREKFLKEFSKEQVFNFSNVDSFKEKVETISTDFPNKIRKSNFFKASCALTEAIDGIKNELDVNIIPTYKKLSNETDNTNKQIDFHVEKLQPDLKSSLNNIISKTKSEMQQEIYDYIDSDVGNDDFKARLKSILEAEQKILPTKFDEGIQNCLDKFSDNVEKTIEKFKERIDETCKINSRYSCGTYKFDFNVDLLDIKSIAPGKIEEVLGATTSAGLSIWGLVAAGAPLIKAGAGAALTANVVAIIAVASIAVISSLVFLTKSIFGFFNHDYRKSEQRKNADKVLNEFEAKLKQAIREPSENTYDEVKSQIQQVKDIIAKPLINAKKVQELIEAANDNLISLQKDTKLVEAIA